MNSTASPRSRTETLSVKARQSLVSTLSTFRTFLNGFARRLSLIGYASMPQANMETKHNVLTITLRSSGCQLANIFALGPSEFTLDGHAASCAISFETPGDMVTFISALSNLTLHSTSLSTSPKNSQVEMIRVSWDDIQNLDECLTVLASDITHSTKSPRSS